MPRIRTAREDELPLIREIERASGAPFRDVGMAQIADEEPMSLADLTHYWSAGRAWVVTFDDDVPVGFLLAEPVDGHLHIAQISVHPDAAGQRLGSALIDYLDRRAAEAGVDELSLTTYLDVPWNGPYYRTLGFAELPEAEWGEGLRAIRRMEREAGLDTWPRLVMVRPVPGAG
ncbi:GNAT family N-acetyltransferase [Pseudonocardia spinosispora]|uniref:GNAT family N-acetyltransferase n=1 Tax=Pseudonocardia spinosispora TaxID=103441 RepID=UPI00041F7B0B|nr:GNAT family N-acetyltransferase [Pseudonocardia spinosispora]